MEIKFNKETSVNELHRMSAHLGMKLGAPDFVASTDDDTNRIDNMWSGAVAELAALLLPYATYEFTQDGVIYRLVMPSNWKETREKNLIEQCRLFLHQALFARWLDYIRADSAMLYRTLNNDTASVITHLLSLRKKPIR